MNVIFLVVINKLYQYGLKGNNDKSIKRYNRD